MTFLTSKISKNGASYGQGYCGTLIGNHIPNIWNGTMFGDLDWPLNASRGLSASAELLVHGASASVLSSVCSITLWYYIDVCTSCQFWIDVRLPVPSSWSVPDAGLHMATAHFRSQELGHGTRYRPVSPPRRLSLHFGDFWKLLCFSDNCTGNIN